VETERLGDPSVLDLFHYHNHAAAPGTQNMSSHSDPGAPGSFLASAPVGRWLLLL
jgi:hypothetical protein